MKIKNLKSLIAKYCQAAQKLGEQEVTAFKANPKIKAIFGYYNVIKNRDENSEVSYLDFIQAIPEQHRNIFSGVNNNNSTNKSLVDKLFDDFCNDVSVTTYDNGYFDMIPNEVIFNIFSFCDAKSLQQLAGTSRFLFNLTSDQNFWNNKLIKIGINPSLLSEIGSLEYDINYRLLYFKLQRLTINDRSKISKVWELVLLDGKVTNCTKLLSTLEDENDLFIYGSGENNINIFQYSVLSGSIPLVMHLKEKFSYPFKDYLSVLIYFAVLSKDVNMLNYIIKEWVNNLAGKDRDKKYNSEIMKVLEFKRQMLMPALKHSNNYSYVNAVELAAYFGLQLFLPVWELCKEQILLLTNKNVKSGDTKQLHEYRVYESIFFGEGPVLGEGPIRTALVGKDYKAVISTIAKLFPHNMKAVESQVKKGTTFTNSAKIIFTRDLIHIAARKGCVERLKYALSFAMSCRSNLRVYTNVLHYQVDHGSIDMVASAISSNNLACVKLALELICDPKLSKKYSINDLQTSHYYTYLHLAVLQQNLEMVKFFLKQKNIDLVRMVDRGPYQYMDALALASSLGATEIMQAIFKNLDEKSKFLCVYGNISNSGLKLIHLAAKSGVISAIEYAMSLPENGINSLTRDCQTIVHIAATTGSLDVLKFAIANGFDLSILNDLTLRDGLPGGKENLIHRAVSHGNIEFLAYLIDELFANPNATDNRGKTILEIAIETLNVNVVKFCIERKLLLNLTDKQIEDALVSAQHLVTMKVASQYLQNPQDDGDEYQMKLISIREMIENAKGITQENKRQKLG